VNIVTELTTYPFKSAQGISADSFGVSESGFPLDRHYALLNGEGRKVTQRQVPGLAKIATRLEYDEAIGDYRLLADLPEVADSLTLDQLEPVDTLTAKFGDKSKMREFKVDILDYYGGDNPTRLFRHFIQVHNPEYRGIHDTYLARIRPDSPQTSPSFGSATAMSDKAPLLMTFQNSLDAFNEETGLDIPMNRFRPNIVADSIRGPREDMEMGPFSEFSVSHFRIGAMMFRNAGPCARCPVPSIDQDTGAKTQDAVTRKLSGLASEDYRYNLGNVVGVDRRNKSQGGYFGVNLVPVPELSMAGKQKVSVGNMVMVAGDLPSLSEEYL